MSRLPTPPWTQPSRLLRSLWLPHRSRNRSQPSPRSTNSSWRMLLPNSLLRLSTISLALPVSNPPYRHRRSNRWSTPPPLVIRGCHHHQPPCQTTGVQNIRFVIPVVLGLASSTYACWCDLITSHYIPTPLTTTPQRHGVSHYSFLAKDG